jgi:hypothetical protein
VYVCETPHQGLNLGFWRLSIASVLPLHHEGLSVNDGFRVTLFLLGSVPIDGPNREAGHYSMRLLGCVASKASYLSRGAVAGIPVVEKAN